MIVFDILYWGEMQVMALYHFFFLAEGGTSGGWVLTVLALLFL